MGRPKRCIGRRHKNYEKKKAAKRHSIEPNKREVAVNILLDSTCIPLKCYMITLSVLSIKSLFLILQFFFGSLCLYLPLVLVHPGLGYGELIPLLLTIVQ